MMNYIGPFIGLCIALVMLHDPLMNQLDKLIDRFTKDPS